MEHFPEKTKDDVRKILFSKNLFYEEMGNYHSRLQIAADIVKQTSTPKSRDDHEPLGATRDENGGDDEAEKEKNDEGGRDPGVDGIGAFRAKRIRLSKESEGSSPWISDNLHDSIALENQNPVMVGMLQPDNERTAPMQPDSARSTAWMAEKIELKRQKLKNEKMKLENKLMALELKQMELDIESNRFQERK